MEVYLDNATATLIDEDVFAAMLPYLRGNYGAPGATHAYGRAANTIIEKNRSRVAAILGVSGEEITFTSGDAESLRLAITSAIENTGVDHIITTKFEHPATAAIFWALQRKFNVRISYVKHYDDGAIDFGHLAFLLRTNTRNFISFSHANIETGNLNDIEKITDLAGHYKALLHIDAIYTTGHFSYDLSKIDFLSASADRFHGPAGIGFLYNRSGTRLVASNMESSYVAGIVGLSKALELAYSDLDHRREYINQLKQRLASELSELIPDSEIIGNSAIDKKGHFAFLSIRFLSLFKSRSLIHYLDESGISVSGKSHSRFETIHFTFSKYNTPEEIDYVIDHLSGIYERVSY